MLLVHPVNEVIRFLPVIIGIFVLGSGGDEPGQTGSHDDDVSIHEVEIGTSALASAGRVANWHLLG
jgi:hypothetical protein